MVNGRKFQLTGQFKESLKPSQIRKSVNLY